MSASPPKADKQADVSLSPLCARNGLTHRSKSHLSFDHLVGACEKGFRNRKADRFRGFEIDDEFELGGLIHRQVGGRDDAFIGEIPLNWRELVP
jgi:hypothetical protein